jgi:hypothetical protein
MIQRLRLAFVAGCLAPLLFAASATAAATTLPSAQSYLPPAGTVFQGVATKPVSAYSGVVHKHPAVYQEFVAWGQWLPGITADATANRARLMIEITTAYGSTNRITPQGIASGDGDGWLIGLAQQFAASNNITYVRLMAEMNNCNNPYAADNCDGSSRGSAYSASEFKQAWRRATLIFRGGSVAAIDAELRQLGMPALRTGRATLATPDVAMMWVPMVGGNPDVPGLEPGVYFPGSGSTGSAQISTAATRTGRDSSSSMTTTPITRSCSASTPSGTATTRAGSSPCSAGSQPISARRC